ncbi:MAG: radical SAM protein, partial [Methanomicrobiales archaeon]
MPDTVTIAVGAVRWWLGNPISLAMLRFLTGHDDCGYRLENAMDYYLTGSNGTEYCWKCRLAGRILGWTCRRGGSIFGVDETDIKGALSEEVFRKGLASVLEGFTRYGVTLPQRLHAPFLVVWDLTRACNLRCRHCYQRAGRPLPEELSTDEALALVDELADAGVVALSLSGGEPLMRRDLFDIAARARDRGMYVSCASNGTLITPDVARRMKESGIEYVEISLDAPDAATHDAFRGMPGAFERTCAGVRACVDAGLFTCVAATATRHTCPQVPDLYALSADLGVQRFICFNFIPTGRGVEITDQDLEPEQREELLHYIFRQNGTGGPEALSTAPQFARVAVEGCEGSMALGHFYYGDHFPDRTRALAEFIGGC